MQAAADCQACALCHGRKQVVFGAAPDTCRADWLVLGEPPDEDEEREGRVFVGPAGVLMDNMLRAVEARRLGLLEKENRLDEEVSAAGSLGLGRAFLTPSAKCRPASGRKATAAELRQCEPILRQQVALVQPKIILAMGLQAAQVVLACVIPDVHRMPLGKLRGNVHRYQGVPVVVTYSPRSLLRTPMDKGKAWADLCLARQQLSSPER